MSEAPTHATPPVTLTTLGIASLGQLLVVVVVVVVDPGPGIQA